MEHSVELELGGKKLRVETGRVARQANGAVLLHIGETVILATATMSKAAREGCDFFPLTCDYEERKYAVGKIPGGFVKRGGRPSERAILTSRLIDRPVRPLFPDGMRNDVQVIAMPVSVDLEVVPDVMAVTAAAFALAVSDIPFQGPMAAVRVTRVEGELIVNPSYEQTQAGDIDLVVAGTREAVNMLECEAKQIPEDDIAAAIDVVGALAADVLAQAILRGVRTAQRAVGLPGAAELEDG